MNTLFIRNKFFHLCSLVIMLLSINTIFAQKHSATSAHTSFTGTSMTGYQGWFGTPGDGGTNSWRHYSGSSGFQQGSASIEYWPDMREADEDEKYITDYVFDDGAPAYVFSSVNPKTVNRHFQWMKEYGIDGALMQRFRSDFGLIPTMNKILTNGLNAAWANDRAIGLMYDIGANIHVDGVPNDAKRTEEVNKIFDDFKYLVDSLGLTTGGDNQPYIYHNGKPLVVLWGVGFSHRHNTEGLDMEFWVQLVDSFKNSPEYGGCSIMVGVPREWRTGSGMSEHTKFLELIETIEIVNPWHTSRYRRDQMPTDFKNIVTADIAWCNANGIDYTPTVSPGIREKILHEDGYEKPREGGYYFWDMAKAALEAGSEMLYLGMFDEIDEGTQYHKINNNPPFYRDDLSFADYGTDPEDHYLWLAGEATRALKGEFTMGSTYRDRADDKNFQSEITFVDSGSTYYMELTTPADGRKVYYADPYKVPDGAPTMATLRNTELFKNELSSEVIEFSEEERGLHIRFVEVDVSTDEIISYQSIVATHRYATIPYVTSFEEGVIDERFWTTHTENDAGRIKVNNIFGPYTGKYHLTIDATGAGSYSTNIADLHVDLEGATTEILLNFAHKTYGNEVNPEDGIYFSNNAGENFTKVYDFGNVSVYTNISLNLSNLADSAGILLSDKFVVRFQHKANLPISQDGIALDDVKVVYSDIPSGFGQFLERDEATQGEWIGSYGVDGQYIVGRENNTLPEYATISWDSSSSVVVWDDSTSDERGLQLGPDSTILAARYSETEDHPWWFILDLGENEKNVSVYFLDGDNQDRQFIVNVIDKANGDKYDVQTVRDFGDGVWLTWKISGKVKFEMELLSGPNAVVSGIFFDPHTFAEIEVENSLTFDGVDDFVDCGRDESLQISGTEITLEGWFKINKTKDATWQSTILAMDHGEADNDVGYFLRANNGQINWGFGDGDWHEVKSEEGVELFEDSVWNHVAGVYDGISQKIYINGNLLVDSLFTATIKPTEVEPLYIGSTPYFDNRVIEASLAEIRIWNIARTDSEIKEFAKKRITGSEEGLVAYWPIDEGEGKTIFDISSNSNDGLLGGTIEESSFDPLWTEGEPVVKMKDILADYNGSFESDTDLEFWRFFEVPNNLGSKAEIINGDVVNGANAARITFVEPDSTLADRGFDNWDSNMELEPETEYLAKFWAKSDTSMIGKLDVGYGSFDTDRKVIAEGGISFYLTEEYKEYEFSYTTPAGTAKGWLSFRWKHTVENEHMPGIIYLDYVQLWTVDEVVSMNDISNVIPDKYELKQNYPNPFNPSTTISYSIPENSKVELGIYNILGQKVAVLVNQNMNAGSYQVTWNASNFATGIYIMAMKANATFLTKKMILLK